MIDCPRTAAPPPKDLANVGSITKREPKSARLWVDFIHSSGNPAKLLLDNLHRIQRVIQINGSVVLDPFYGLAGKILHHFIGGFELWSFRRSVSPFNREKHCTHNE